MNYKDYDLIIHTIKDKKTNPYELILLYNVMQTLNKQENIPIEKYFNKYVYKITHKYYLRKSMELENKMEYHTKELCSEITKTIEKESMVTVNASETFKLVLFILENFRDFEVVDYFGNAKGLKTQISKYLYYTLPRVLTEDEAELFNQGKWLEITPIILMLTNIQLCGYVRIESCDDYSRTFMKNSSKQEYNKLINHYKEKWSPLIKLQ